MRDLIDKVTLFEAEGNLLTLWHGGRDLQYTYDEIRGHGKGRWEHGPGLYLTDNENLARKYAKGSRRLYRVTIDLTGAHEISDILLPMEDMIEFVNRHVKVASRKELIDEFKRIAERRPLTAATLANLCLNLDAITSTKTADLRRFLVDHGVDYIDSSSFSSRIIVVVNPKIIKKVEFAK